MNKTGNLVWMQGSELEQRVAPRNCLRKLSNEFPELVFHAEQTSKKYILDEDDFSVCFIRLFFFHFKFTEHRLTAS